MKKVLIILTAVIAFIYSVEASLTADELAAAQGISWFEFSVPEDMESGSGLFVSYKKNDKSLGYKTMFLYPQAGSTLKLFILKSDNSKIYLSAIQTTPYQQRSQSYIKNRFRDGVCTSFRYLANSGTTHSLEKPVALLCSNSESDKDEAVTLYVELKKVD